MDAIVTPAEMGAIDRAAPEPVEVLIGRAGGAVAREAVAMMGGTYGRRVVVVAGPGNNGADGREAARRLEARGVRCQVFEAGQAPQQLPPSHLVIDAAYGTGFRGEYRAPRPASPDTAVLAVDIPSGVDGLTGVAAGAPLAATRTVTFAAWKPGLLLADGAELAGSVTVADIGLDVSGASAHLVDDAAVSGWLPPRPRASHKWRHAVRLVAGSPGMAGAAHLSAAAAMRAGAGYVRLSTPGAGPGETDAPLECVVTPLPGRGWAAAVARDELHRFGALAVGPGLGRSQETAEQLDELLASVLAGAAAPGAAEAGRTAVVPVVIDGDGLTALGEGAPRLARGLTQRPAHGPAHPVVLTPHDGEYATLAGHPPGEYRIEAARHLARTTGAVVLLKGPTTVVAAPDGAVLVGRSGDSRLATAGTGDVLTGIIAALLARGVDPLHAAAAGAHIHGRAGALAWPLGMVAGDLPALIPVVLSELQET